MFSVMPKYRLSCVLTLLGVQLLARTTNLRQLQLQAPPVSNFVVQDLLQQGVQVYV
jgi:hypothetical protein